MNSGKMPRKILLKSCGPKARIKQCESFIAYHSKEVEKWTKKILAIRKECPHDKAEYSFDGVESYLECPDCNAICG